METAPGRLFCLSPYAPQLNGILNRFQTGLSK
jgi:hypothetical protein